MYATKPVFSLFTAGSKRAGMQAERGEGMGAFREGGYGERERKTSTKKQQHFKTFWEKQVVNGLKNNCRGGGQPFRNGRWLADRQCFGRPIKRKDSIVGRVTPPQSESSIAPENHEREEKKREKHKNTKRGEIHVSEEIKKATTQTPQTDHVPEHRGGSANRRLY